MIRAASSFSSSANPASGAWGNGCLQDILFRARIHPRRRALDLSEGERSRLHAAIRDTLQQMVALGGRDGEIDLFGQPGATSGSSAARLRASRVPNAGRRSKRSSTSAAASYFCPKCQV